ncbi:glycerophosphodiester phosphodiesterase [Xylophilus sp. GOD-11R]|uniref:glycerophosphodiester phosphodiesterase n=1 Tax=Xylophilus sp. GOD-11R TaxID=3089814 RepID=UPI00298D479A|nr:glycerophosphodiester phosphodiesterase family protein [Xylophilus sp. GOD-11R]WPB58078.1 glycerophosphodiester phosphodiesterase family protein [Xylophilus sp. GOD-11R]
MHLFRRLAAAATALICTWAVIGPALAAPPAPLVIAHRGVPGDAPENTLASYRVAIAAQADHVETDVALTADGEVILMHDADLRRTTNAAEVFPGRASYDVSTFTLSEIRELDAGRWFSVGYTGEKVPTLDELLALLARSGTGLFLELKSADADLAARVAARLVASGWLRDGVPTQKLVVISFNAEHLRKMHTLLPSVELAWITGKEVNEAQLADLATYAQGLDIHHSLMNRALVDLCARYRLKTYVWTVDAPADVDRMLGLGLDGITTDVPAYLRSRLAR